MQTAWQPKSSPRMRTSLEKGHARQRSTDIEGAAPARRAGQPDAGIWRLMLSAFLGWLLVRVVSPDISQQDGDVRHTDLGSGHQRVAAPTHARPRTDVETRPPLRDRTAYVEERFLAYFPHSGYHNQRISLENALTLAHILNRTLLVPPARLGNAIPYISFDKLYLRTNQATKVGLEHCKHSRDVMSHECIGYFDWTQVAWDFLVDFELAASHVPVIDRWNGTYEWLESELGVHRRDIHELHDDRMYQFKFYDTPGDTAPLDKYEKRIDIESLHKYDRYKLLHLGTLFGTSRLRPTQVANWEARSRMRRSMVFRNPLVDRITDAIQGRLGGGASYFGLHLRVGDGLFLKHARQNARDVLRRLLEEKLHLDQDIVDGLLHESDVKRGVLIDPATIGVEKRDAPAPSPGAQMTHAEPSKTAALVKRANSRPQRENTFKHEPLPPLPTIRDRASSPLHTSLACRGPLYTDDALLKLNAPVFLATDSRQPTADAHLAVLFDVLPCLFILGDFGGRTPSAINSEPIPELADLDTLVNADDGVPLAQFLFPIIDMVTAAKARAIVGTASSTFSRFAIDVLYQVYHGWEIVERG